MYTRLPVRMRKEDADDGEETVTRVYRKEQLSRELAISEVRVYVYIEVCMRARVGLSHCWRCVLLLLRVLFCYGRRREIAFLRLIVRRSGI